MLLERLSLATLHETFLERSGQRWKLALLYHGVVWGGAVALVAFLCLGSQVSLPGMNARSALSLWRSLFLVGAFVSCGTIVWATSAIRCPACSLRLLWNAMRTFSAAAAFGWLASFQQCPSCQSDGAHGA